jgi:hypothetical protein
MSHIVRDLTSGKPLARMVPLSAPTGETEAEFYHRLYSASAKERAALERDVIHLRDLLHAAYAIAVRHGIADEDDFEGWMEELEEVAA